MDDKLFSVENLSRFLGVKRSNGGLRAFIEQSGATPVSTVDKEDDADDEYVEFKEQGVGFYFENDTLVSIFLHSGSDGSGYAKYDHPLPMGIQLDQSKADVVALLGSPNAEGGGRRGSFGEIRFGSDTERRAMQYMWRSTRTRKASVWSR
jgi:hypothetical protein